MADQPPLAVGVDFGATKTVVTYYCPTNRTVKEWHPNGRNPIIPSRISYGPLNQVSWGHDVAGSPSTRSAVDEGIFGKAKVPGVGRKPIQPQGAIRDFLGALRDKFLADQTIRAGLGLDSLPPINWYFAMPDCWTLEGERMMRDAIREAGFEQNRPDQVFYASEAKAAALRVARQLENQAPIQVGDCVLVGDLGGLTCEYTAFRVAAMPNDPVNPLFHPLYSKSTMEHGSHLVETSLMNHIRAVLDLPCKTGQPAAVARNGAIEAKHRFSGDAEVVVDLPFQQQYKTQNRYTPSNQYNEQTDEFTFTVDSLVKAFDPTVESIINHFERHSSVECDPSRPRGWFQRPIVRYLGGTDAPTAVSYGLTLRGSIVSDYAAYQSSWGYELAAPIIEMLATGLHPLRNHAIRLIDLVGILPISMLRFDLLSLTFAFLLQARDRRKEGSVHFWLAVEAGQSVQAISIRRFTEAPNRVQMVGEIKPSIPDNARRGVYRPPGAEEISWYECLASWTIYRDVRERMKWKLTIRTDNTWEKAGTADHLVTDMLPWH
ncbi:hypothetical protein AbraIFM66951_007261 [Aspergillus brasiliensis]|uniref:Actin-like ATPase domain-containing protein n=1 Tax=Aspergillus brasiliensis TaxID=319629 RepID=A0A9W5YTJ1_9EURO|nr:hypothetical protein AbraCBS73388_007897 [Aspergillus brasiliensis]GKZ44916.1 hypothetical protein AbraIFM66951_007261 [Aspergillus brasiliensis]